MDYYRNKYNMNETPSLELMTRTALKVIAKNEKGFFLMVRTLIYRLKNEFND